MGVFFVFQPTHGFYSVATAARVRSKATGGQAGHVGVFRKKMTIIIIIISIIIITVFHPKRTDIN